MAFRWDSVNLCKRVSYEGVRVPLKFLLRKCNGTESVVEITDEIAFKKTEASEKALENRE